eukprot:CCRYP_015747-RA/>CCRYP_015747-RA protein AED:0.30 eAED:0.30 QI:0/-1/0/1/-1/1/1/0/362
MVVSIAEEMNPTRRNTMEDVHEFHGPATWNCPDDNAVFIGVYDGHGGRSIVDYLEDHLASNVATEWCVLCRETRGDGSDGDGRRKKRRLQDDGGSSVEDGVENEKENDSDGKIIRTSLERAFLLTDIQSRMAGLHTSGATVACCIVVPKFSSTDGSLESISVHCANAGDARIVLSSPTARKANCNDSKLGLPLGTDHRSDAAISSTCAVRLTHDHKATDPKEISRIQSAGGMMLRGRVLGVLAVARSLGDHGLKEFVIGRPFLSSTVISIENNEVHPSSDKPDKKKVAKECSPFTDGEFLVVACDGLWDVMEDQEVVDLVRKFVGNSTSGISQKQEKAAQFLIDEALRRGSTDNITVIVYWL